MQRDRVRVRTGACRAPAAGGEPVDPGPRRWGGHGAEAGRPVGGGPRNPEWFREDFRALLELLREGRIHPVVAERLPLSDARHAHELLESSADKGKLVLVP